MTQGKRRLLIGLVVLAAAAAAGAYYFWPKKAPMRFETAKVERGKIVGKVTAVGNLSAIVTVQVGTQVSGTIAKWFTDFNAPVKKGTVLAQIDPALFQAAVEQADANYVAAKGNLEKAKVLALNDGRIYERAKNLFAEKLMAEADLQTAEATYLGDVAGVAAAEGAVAQAKAALHQARINLGYTTIVSPTNGIVVSRLIDIGQTVAASLQTPTLFTIAQDLTAMQVDTNVAEGDVGKLWDGMDATFTVDAYPNVVFHGKVRQVRNSPQVLQNVVTYDAVIDVRNDDFRLKPGMTANATFVYAVREDALRLANAALRYKPPREPRKPGAPAAKPGEATPGGEKPGEGTPGEGVAGDGARGGTTTTAAAVAPRPTVRPVWVLRNEKPVEVKVTLGISDGTMTEILSDNLQDGDELVTDSIQGPGAAASGQRPGGFRMF